MALTVANISHPNTNVWEGELLGLKARVVDLTFDSSYLTGGEPLTAAEVGWNQLHGAIPLTNATTSNGSAAYAVQARPSADRKKLDFQLHSATNSVAALPQVASAVDASTYTVRVILIGS